VRLWRSHQRLAVLGSGSCFPGSLLSNEELLQKLEGQLGWTGRARALAVARQLQVRSRYTVRDFEQRLEGPRAGDSNPDLAGRALRSALDEAGLQVNQLGYLIGHTATPHYPLPSNISQVAVDLGYDGPFCEFRQACTGFVNALVFAAALLQTPDSAPIAIVGSETGSVFLDPRRTQADDGQMINLMQMGDGAAAVILGPSQPGGAWIERIYHGQRSSECQPGLLMKQGGSAKAYLEDQQVSEFHHDFGLVRGSGERLLRAGVTAAAELGLDLEKVTHFLPHQANGRIGQLMRPFLPAGSQVLVQADRVGNTGSAAIWLALDESRRALQPGQTIWVLGAEATRGMFGGFHYGSD
jgi:3-oxoacyl-[acyl-carrier-protein] synthase-3